MTRVSLLQGDELSGPPSLAAFEAFLEKRSDDGRPGHIVEDQQPQPEQVDPALIAALQDEAYDEIAALEQVKRDKMRDADHVTVDMVHECKLMLRLFGLPYIVAPAEAEAQCAALELAGFVEGVVSDDSDTLLFGARCVYRNVFDQKRHAERYRAEDIAREFGLDRDRLIAIAMLLGSDYTDGVHGVGIVNAVEIVAAFLEAGRDVVEGLVEFRQWVYGGGTGDDDSDSATKKAFKRKHSRIRTTWGVSTSFPDETVMRGYLKPNVDDSREPISWGEPQYTELARLCRIKFDWDAEYVDQVLKPLIASSKTSAAEQMHIDSFFFVQGKFCNVESRRVHDAVKALTGTAPELSERTKAKMVARQQQKGQEKKKMQRKKRTRKRKRDAAAHEAEEAKMQKKKKKKKAKLIVELSSEDDDDDDDDNDDDNDDNEEEDEEEEEEEEEADGDAACKIVALRGMFTINRAPLLVLWAAVVSVELGHSWETAITIGRFIATKFARSKAARLGIDTAASASARLLWSGIDQDYAIADTTSPSAAKERTIQVLGCNVTLRMTADGERAVQGTNGHPLDSRSGDRYLRRAFGDKLDAVRQSMEHLARSFSSKQELASVAYSLYLHFRPAVDAGRSGWAQKGLLDLEVFHALAERWSLQREAQRKHEKDQEAGEE